jgi:hypothetical protein
MIIDLHFIILALKSQVKIQCKMAPATLSVVFAAICSAAFFVLSRNWIMSPLPLLDTLVCFVRSFMFLSCWHRSPFPLPFSYMPSTFEPKYLSWLAKLMSDEQRPAVTKTVQRTRKLLEHV